jgi:hypothetical protein
MFEASKLVPKSFYKEIKGFKNLLTSKKYTIKIAQIKSLR